MDTTTLVLEIVLFTMGLSMVWGVYSPPTFTYHDHDALTMYLNHVTEEFPDRAHLYSIGTSVQGRELWVLAIAHSYPDRHVLLRPEVKYVGNMHGNEVVSRNSLIHFIDHLLTHDGSDGDVTNLMHNARVHVLVSMNPDGFEHTLYNTEIGDCTGVDGRYNENGVDLNRNFPDRLHDTEDSLQPETKAVMKWIKEHQFVLSANLHGGAIVASYGYDNNKEMVATYTATQDDDVFVHLAKTYSYAHAYMSNGSSCGDNFTDGITNGAEWYPIIGGMQDYNYIEAGCMEVTLEIACCKYPDESTLEQHWLENRDSLVKYLLQGFLGVRGTISSNKGYLLQGALVKVKGRKDHGVHTTKHGEYWRLLLSGDYTLQVYAPGYEYAEIDFTVPRQQDGTLYLDVTLLVDETSPATSNAPIPFELTAFIAMVVLFKGTN